MSDILIKGMEMPTVGYILIVLPSGRTLKISADSTQNILGEAQAIPVTPHGRLIDADAAIRNGWTINRTYPASPTEMIYEVREIDFLPTIIPAEEGE